MTEKKDDTSFAVEGAEALFEEALAAVEKKKDETTTPESSAEASPAKDDEDVNIVWEDDADGTEEEVEVDEESTGSGKTIDSSEVIALRAELEELRSACDEEAAERKKLHEQLLRVSAEFDNFRKRTQREKEELRKYGHKAAMSDLLDVLDNFDRAIETLQHADDSVREGIGMVHKQLIDILGRHGVKTFDALHEPFDYTRHEALSIVETDELAPQMVHTVFQAGYELHDVLLRPARVVVSKAPAAPKPEVVEETKADGDANDDATAEASEDVEETTNATEETAGNA